MRKLNSLILACIWIAVAFVLVWLLITGFSSGMRSAFVQNFNRDFSIKINDNGNLITKSGFRSPLISEEEFSLESVESLNIDLVSEAVHINETNNDTFSVAVYSSLPEDSVPKVSCINGVLSVARRKGSIFNSFGIVNDGGVVEITVPRKAMNNTSFFADVNTVSGSIHIEDLGVSTLDVHNTSGSVHLSDCVVKNLTAKNTSGSIKCYGIQAESAETSSTSGSISFEDCIIDEVSATNTSGSVRFSGNLKQIDARTVSGSIRVESASPIEQDSSLATVSGGIRMSLPKNDGFVLRYSSSSGSVNNAFTGFSGKKNGSDVYKDGNIQIEATSVSGSIRIEKN